jgi:hypothetical protein
LHRILPSLNLFEIFFWLIGLSFVLGVIGVYLLIRDIRNRGDKGDREWMAILAAMFFALGPIIPFLFRFSGGIYLVAFSFLPWLLLGYLRLLRKWSLKLVVILIGLLTFVILLDSLIIPTLIFGMAAIFLVQVGWKRAEEKLKKSFWLLAVSFLLATCWYTPGYWLTLLGAPSLAGKVVVGVIAQLAKLLPTAFALVMAIVSVKFFKKKDKFRDFCFYWLFIFGFLTLLRFLSDPDFWMDWTSYAVELQFGLAILGGLVVGKKRAVSIFAGILVLVIWLLIFNQLVIGTLQEEIEGSVEYRIGRLLSETAKGGEKVFLSGTTAFWLNAFFDVVQVRGRFGKE